MIRGKGEDSEGRARQKCSHSVLGGQGDLEEIDTGAGFADVRCSNQQARSGKKG